ncbi:PepSY-associated TM helix domain-containing protein [Cesiribacter sp. SM1]|uniref:PepSY-associated TM helix domain-containing protein n=1 Tax=Cesiribacter sp. SM1 TaxID=2861196 RepID=UPI001CD444D7|nr:PepSY-associated TM helix domain-containing protein [Cesiribacter sp. SM1]
MKAVTENIAKQTRFYRNLHKWVAIPLLLFMLLIGVTGLLLGWKKQTSLLPPTQNTTASAATGWISLDSIQHIALNYSSVALGKSSEIDRIDVRPAKGVAKVRFADHFTELQIDGKTGTILSVSHRTSDLIEMIHDGSIVEYLVGTGTDGVKLLYTTLVSIGLILLSISGFWLWYNPKRIRKAKTSAKVQTARTLH